MGKVIPFVIPLKPANVARNIRKQFTDEQVAEIEAALMEEDRLAEPLEGGALLDEDEVLDES